MPKLELSSDFAPPLISESTTTGLILWRPTILDPRGAFYDN